jgi:hypothetical protein
LWGVLRKISVLRLNFPCLLTWEIFCLSNGIFNKYPFQTLFVTWQLLNTIGRFELFPSAGTVVVFRFVMSDSIPNEFGGLRHVRVKKWNRGICEKLCHFFTFAASNRQIHSEYFFFTFIHKVTWLIKFETRTCSDVKDIKIN